MAQVSSCGRQLRPLTIVIDHSAGHPYPGAMTNRPDLASFTTSERDVIRREMGQRFGSFPCLADGVWLRTWRTGERKGQPKIPPAIQTMMERGIVFSGSLYALALTNFKWFGAITPLGGLGMLAGWLVLALAKGKE